MSDHGHGQQGPGGAAEGSGADTVDYSKVVGVGIAALVVFALSILWSSRIYTRGIKAAEEKGGRAAAVDTTRPEIGIVDQVPFEHDARLKTWKGDRRAELEHYGWVDKSKGVVRIPIDVAMDKVAGGAMPAGAPR
jgi:hypothetical protein